jgi:hypothetical protein
MDNVRLIITGRIEEVPTIGKFTMDAAQDCQGELAAYKPSKYTAAFTTSLETKQAAIKQIVAPSVMTNEMKVITMRLMTNVTGLRQTMNLLEGYVADAGTLTVAKADFGIKDVRKKISSLDVEGLHGALNIVITNITNNSVALLAVGYTAAMKTALEAMQESIFEDNAEQNAKQEARAQLVVANLGKINDFLTDIKGIWADGKRLYNLTNKVKAKMFSNAEIIRRIRNDELHTIITGKVLDKDGKIAEGAKIVARPSSDGKRGKTVKSNSEGVYELKGLRPVNFVLTVTLKNGGVFVANADAVTNEAVVMDLKEHA